MLTPRRKHTTTPKPAAKRVYSEAKEQRVVVAWAKASGWFIAAIENARERKWGAARDKALGLKDGMPDLFLMWQTHAIWLEMKSVNGRLSPGQEQCHTELLARGQHVIVGMGAKNAIQKLKAFQECTTGAADRAALPSQDR